jgi:hypothetical protein
VPESCVDEAAVSRVEVSSREAHLTSSVFFISSQTVAALLMRRSRMIRSQQLKKNVVTFVYFFGGLECVGHSFAYVAYF